MEDSFHLLISCSDVVLVEEAQWSKPLTYLGEVDSYKQLKVHCFVSAGYVKFMLLHTGKSDDAIKALFMDVHELYLKVYHLGFSVAAHDYLDSYESFLCCKYADHIRSIRFKSQKRSEQENWIEQKKITFERCI